jgi:hypothetical protein
MSRYEDDSETCIKEVGCEMELVDEGHCVTETFCSNLIINESGWNCWFVTYVYYVDGIICMKQNTF